MFSLNININDIIQFLIKNKTMFIPGILYLIFNNLISPYIIAVIIGSSLIQGGRKEIIF